MQPFNLEVLRNRAREIRGNLARIRVYAGQSDAEFFADERNLYTLMHLLLISIEAVGSICNHLAAKTALAAPASYAECFDSLRGSGILDDALANRMVQMARLRNILVHRYWEIKPDLILRYSRENLGDFESFLRSVGQFVGESL